MTVRRTWTWVTCAGLAWLAVAGESATDRTDPLAATRALRERLVRAGRAEARLAQRVTDPNGEGRWDRGRVALEVPDRLRVDFDSTGERVTVRGDGGEWLQPALRQMIRLAPDQARATAAVFAVFLDGGEWGFREQAVGPRRFLLRPRTAEMAVPDSVWIEVDGEGLPSRLDAVSGEQRWTLQFRRWRFLKPVGSEGFRLRAPDGFVVLEAP